MTSADVVIIGSGPSGIQAAIHAARKKVSVVLFGKISNSAMAGTHVENYFAISENTSGDDMLSAGLSQAIDSGCEVYSENILSVSRDGDYFDVVSENGNNIHAKSIILATGISRVKLGIPGEKELQGRGVSYCAVCDCNFYKGKKVVIIGDETEAAASAEMMTKYASETYWVSKDTKASEVMVKRAVDAGVKKISDIPKEIRGDEKVKSLVLESSEIEVDGVFIELGARSSVDLAMDLDVMPEMDDTIKVNGDCSTEVPGVFACGDITGKPWQVAKAVGQGAIAGLAAADYSKKVQ